jgi:hypothetical protein
MISKDKTYRTRDGREVRIYAIDGGGVHCVHGAVRNPEGWAMCSWSLESSCDLIEVKPRIKRTVWLNVYPDKNGDYSQLRGLADALAATDRLACVKVEIDCEEGEGL